MRERAPKLIQPQPDRNAMPVWFWAVILLIIAGVGVGGWLLLGQFNKPSSAVQAVAIASPTAHVVASPTRILTSTPSPPPPSPTIPPPTATPTITLQYGLVKSDANVRERPTTTSPRIGGITRGAIIVLVGKPVQAQSANWYQRQEGGWVSGTVLTVYPTLAEAQKAKP